MSQGPSETMGPWCKDEKEWLNQLCTKYSCSNWRHEGYTFLDAKNKHGVVSRGNSACVEAFTLAGEF